MKAFQKIFQMRNGNRIIDPSVRAFRGNQPRQAKDLQLLADDRLLLMLSDLQDYLDLMKRGYL